MHSVKEGDHGLRVKGGKAAVEVAVREAVDAAVSFAQSALHGPAASEGIPHSVTEGSAAQSAGAKAAKRKRDTGTDKKKQMKAAGEGEKHVIAGKGQKAKASQRKRKGT